MTKRLILIALPLLAACATAGATSVQLEGSEWAFVSIDGKAPVSSKAKLEIATGRIGANVGCNGMGSDLRIVGDRLETGPMISTMMYCDGVMEQEHAVAQLLADEPQFKVTGDKLMLYSGTHRAELKRVN